MLDMPFETDLRLIIRAIRAGEVISLFFPWFGKALILDTRRSAGTPPAIFADDMAGSAEERLRDLARRRPDLPRPARLAAIPWPAGVNALVDTGIYAEFVRRCRALGDGALERDCARALAALRHAERQMKLAYVRGEHCRTLYQK
jgi:hypothetical protein